MTRNFLSPILFSAIVLIGGGCTSPAVSSTTTPVATPTEVSIAPQDSSTPVVTPTEISTTPQDSSSTTPPVKNKAWVFPGILPAKEINNKQIRLTTTLGDIVFKLYDDTAPNTVSNFVNLASGGYYDGLIFHRVISGFMIQGGDPTGTGMSGPGYKFADELKDDRTYLRGTVAMANSGANTNGSQFFIMHKDYPLPHSYSIFGQVTEGLDIVDKIAATKTGAQDRPVTTMAMLKVTVEDVK